MWPRRYLLTLKDSVFWCAFSVFSFFCLLPALNKCGFVADFSSSVTIGEVSTATISFAAILSAVSLAMAAILLALPAGTFLEALDRKIEPSEKWTSPRNIPYLELAFIAYWTGVSSMFLASVSILGVILGGSIPLVDTSNFLHSFGSAVLAGASIHSILQVIACLNAILAAARLSFLFRNFELKKQ